jgi:branched-chain amino acid transport system substrate-binding protein
VTAASKAKLPKIRAFYEEKKMIRMTKKICRLALTASLVAGGAMPLHAAANDIVIVQVADYSASRAALGKALRAGAQTAFNHANDKGGIKGNKIRFVTYDDNYKPDETVKLVQQTLERDKPVLLLGCVGTANTAELRKQEILEKGDTALLAPYTGADSLRTPYTPYIFHIRTSYSEEVDAMVKHLSTVGVKKIAIFHESDPFGNFIYGAFEAASKRYGTQIAGRAVVERGATDLGNALAPLVKAQPGAVIVGTAGAPTVNFIRAARAAGLGQTLIGLSVNDLPSIIAGAGNQASRGFGQVQVMPDPLSCKGVKVCLELAERYEKYGDKSVPLSPVVMEGYVAGRTAIEALKRIKGSPTPQTMRAALEGLSKADLGGFTLSFGPDKRAGSTYMDVGVVNGRGQMVY